MPATLSLESLTLGEDGVTEVDLLVRNETNPVLPQMLATLHAPPAYERSFAEHKPGLRRQRAKQLLHRGNILYRR